MTQPVKTKDWKIKAQHSKQWNTSLFMKIAGKQTNDANDFLYGGQQTPTVCLPHCAYMHLSHSLPVWHIPSAWAGSISPLLLLRLLWLVVVYSCCSSGAIHSTSEGCGSSAFPLFFSLVNEWQWDWCHWTRGAFALTNSKRLWMLLDDNSR
jgi:hypothetical protein